MWSFKKKRNLELAQNPEEEITLLPEEGAFVPEELPELEISAKEEAITMPIKELPSVRIIKTERPSKIMAKEEEIDRFMKMDRFKGVVSKINDMNIDFSSMEGEINRAVELKEQRNEKINNLQNTLEDVSKKLMLIDNTLFGG